jgi:hypothetical protein
VRGPPELFSTFPWPDHSQYKEDNMQDEEAIEDTGSIVEGTFNIHGITMTDTFDEISRLLKWGVAFYQRAFDEGALTVRDRDYFKQQIIDALPELNTAETTTVLVVVKELMKQAGISIIEKPENNDGKDHRPTSNSPSLRIIK